MPFGAFEGFCDRYCSAGIGGADGAVDQCAREGGELDRRCALRDLLYRLANNSESPGLAPVENVNVVAIAVREVIGGAWFVLEHAIDDSLVEGTSWCTCHLLLEVQVDVGGRALSQAMKEESRLMREVAVGFQGLHNFIGTNTIPDVTDGGSVGGGESKDYFVKAYTCRNPLIFSGFRYKSTKVLHIA